MMRTKITGAEGIIWEFFPPSPKDQERIDENERLRHFDPNVLIRLPSADIRIASALERIADALDRMAPPK